VTSNAPIKDPKLVLLQAELTASSPEQVKAWLETRAQREFFYKHEGEAAVEEALLARNDRYIDFALARFGICEKTLATLFARNATDHDRALRIGALLNEQVDFSGLPTVLYSGAGILAASRGRDQLEPFLASLNHEEIAALFSNPAIDNRFLVEFLEEKKPWLALDEQSRMVALMALKDNPRMAAKYEGHMDGYAEHMHNAAFAAAFNLAKTLPVTEDWGHILGGLYFKIKPTAYSIEDPFSIAARWVPDPTQAEEVEAAANQLEEGYTLCYAQVRQGLGRLAVAGHRQKLVDVLTHPDPAIRSAAYRDADLTPEQMKEANAKDPKLGFNTMLYNKKLWRRPETRELLKKMAWEPKRDPRHDLIPQNQFESFSKTMRKEFPVWFAGEDHDSVDEGTLPVTRAEFSVALANVSKLLETPVAAIGSIERAVKTVLGRTVWLWWGVAIALALLLFRR
jgi:hypothetical protein